MNKNYFVVAVIFMMSLFFSLQNFASGPVQPTIGNQTNLNNTANPNQSNNNTINIGITQEMMSNLAAYASSTASSIASSVTNTITSIQTKIQTMMHNGRDMSQDMAHSLADYVQNNKLKLSLYALLGSYSYLHYKLFSLQYALSKDTNWSRWNNAVPLEELFALPQKQLGEIIIKETQRRYTNIENPDDFVTPLVTFIREVDRERELLQLYTTLCVWIRRLYLAKISWINVALETQCQERLQRLAYIKNVFLIWIAEHKFAQYAPAGV